jgi:hypothetical protein
MRGQFLCKLHPRLAYYRLTQCAGRHEDGLPATDEVTFDGFRRLHYTGYFHIYWRRAEGASNLCILGVALRSSFPQKLGHPLYHI